MISRQLLKYFLKLHETALIQTVLEGLFISILYYNSTSETCLQSFFKKFYYPFNDCRLYTNVSSIFCDFKQFPNHQ